MKRWIVSVVALSSLLGGCLGIGSDSDSYLEPSKPIDKMSHEELCAFYVHYRDNPDLSQHAKSVATQQMQAKGCTG